MKQKRKKHGPALKEKVVLAAFLGKRLSPDWPAGSKYTLVRYTIGE